MRKILICLTYYKPNVSGLTIYVERLVNEIRSSNVKCQIICSDHSKISSEAGVTRVKGFRLGKGFLMPLYPIEALREVKKTDVVNCHLPSIESVWSVLWAKIYSKRLIVTYHCAFEAANPWLTKGISIIDRWMLNMADKIVVNSRDYAKRIGIDDKYSNKIVEIYPPIPELKKVNKISVKDKNIKTIGFLGRLSREKKC